MTNESPRPASPTLYEWAGGMPVFEKLTTLFYSRVPHDPILAPVFAQMPADHPHHVAAFVAEVFGGPNAYTEVYGGSHAVMVSHHLGRHLTEAQRRRWVNLMLDCADEVGMPDDPEFRSAFVAYLEWGTRLAVLNSQDGVAPPLPDSPMPDWGWGAVGGPFQTEK